MELKNFKNNVKIKSNKFYSKNVGFRFSIQHPEYKISLVPGICLYVYGYDLPVYRSPGYALLYHALI